MKKYRLFVSFLLLGILCLCTLPVHAEEPVENELEERLAEENGLGLEEWINEEADTSVVDLNEETNTHEVTSMKIVWQEDESIGKNYYTGLFTVDGILAFCIQRSRYIPAAGTATSDWIPVYNDDLRKVLYYGYNGPEDKGYTYVETDLAAAEANGDGGTTIGEAVFAEIKVYDAPPRSFKVWKVETSKQYQDLAFYTIEEENEIEYQLPNTGSAGDLYMSLAGISCCMAVFQKTRRKTK